MKTLLMNRRIKRLAEAGIFRSPRISDLGYGTFLDIERNRTHDGKYIGQARALKKEADSTLPHSRKKGINMYMKTVFLYIKGYLEEEESHEEIEAIHKWKGLGKYVDSVMKLLNGDEKGMLNLFKLILFNLKFHYLYLESSLMYKQHKAGRHKEGQLSYFLKEYNGMYEMFGSSDTREFGIFRLYDLEDFIRSRMENECAESI